ncbi:MAG TPA: hypothetical protein VL500_07625, partial [Candidatus Eisenbacteria bacterium]|nr:hypothetical protein [Candidatus Eisenbacteria bacterium]
PKNRYEVEPPPDKEEQGKEVRPDLQAMETEQGAPSKIDTGYAGSVSKFFNEKRKVANVTEAQDTELFDYDAFLAAEQQSLEKMANPETAKAMKPKDVAMAMGDLAGEMASKNPDRAGNVTGDPKIDGENAAAYGDAKKVFMMAADKAFPNVTYDTKDFGTELEHASRMLREESDASFIPEMDPGDLQKMYDQDPKGLAKKLDEILAKSGDLMRMRSRLNFDNKDAVKQEQDNAHLAAGAEQLYKVQLMRDDLQEKMYGRKDVTAAEAKQIDASRAAFAGKPEAGAEDAEGKSRAALDAVERATVAERGTGSEKVGPALEAMKGVWKKDGALSGRMEALAERVSKMTELKLADDEQVEPAFARKVSILQIYGDLMPAERRALVEAARRQLEEKRRDGEVADTEPVSAERMFAALIETAIKKG